MTGYRIQYKRSAIKRVFFPIGVMGNMSKRLLYTKYLAFSLGAVHLPGRAGATTLACSTAISPSLQVRSSNNSGSAITSNLVRDPHDA